MIWQTPQAFWLLLAVPIVIGVFLYRRKFPVVQVPSLGAWLSIGTPVVQSNWRNWLRRFLILLCQLILISLFIVAGAGPLDHAPPKNSVIVVLDTSATMLSKTSTGVTRFDVAKNKVREILDSSRGEPELILSADVPTVANQGGKRLNEVLQHLEAEPVDGDLAAALDLAHSLAATMADPEVVVISDFVSRNPELLSSKWKPLTLRLVQVGDELPEAGFVSAQVLTGEGGEMHIKGQVAAHGGAGTSRGIRAVVEGHIVGSGSVSLIDGVASFDLPVTIPAATMDNQILDLSLDGPDALEVNNHMSLLLAISKRRVALIGKTIGSLKSLRSLIEASGNVEVQEFMGGQALSDVKADLFVVDNAALPAGALPSNGSYLFINCPDPFNWVSTRERAAAGTPTSWEPSHPLLKDLFPEALRAPTALGAVMDSTMVTSSVLDSGGVPLIVDLRTLTGSAHAVYLLFDPTTSPAGSSLAFPLLILNCLDYLAPPAAGNSPYEVTGTLPVVGIAGEQVTVAGPDGTAIEISTTGHELRTSRLVQAGRYVVGRPGGRSVLPVNYLSLRAADLMPTVPAAVSVKQGRLSRLSLTPMPKRCRFPTLNVVSWSAANWTRA